MNRDEILARLIAKFQERKVSDGDLYGEKGYTRHDFLANIVFGFDTYNEDMDRVFAQRALETCCAITTGTTFQYIEDEDNYGWYLIMCHMPFFESRISWGSSIRGAFWDFGPLEYAHVPLLDEGTEPAHLDRDEWIEFMHAMFRFVGEDPDADA